MPSHAWKKDYSTVILRVQVHKYNTINSWVYLSTYINVTSQNLCLNSHIFNVTIR